MALSIPSTSKEFDLVRRLAAGEEETFRELYAKYSTSMVRLANVFVADEATAEEVTQETWLTVLQKIEQFEGRASLKTWMFRILTNKAKKRGIKDKRIVPFTSIKKSEDGPHVLDPALFKPDGHWKVPPVRWNSDTPEKMAEHAETRAFVTQQVESLPPKERAVVRLRDLELWSSQEVCELLEIEAGYQRVLLHRGRNRMRVALGEYLQRGET